MKNVRGLKEEVAIFVDMPEIQYFILSIQYCLNCCCLYKVGLFGKIDSLDICLK